MRQLVICGFFPSFGSPRPSHVKIASRFCRRERRKSGAAASGRALRERRRLRCFSALRRCGPFARGDVKNFEIHHAKVSPRAAKSHTTQKEEGEKNSSFSRAPTNTFLSRVIHTRTGNLISFLPRSPSHVESSSFSFFPRRRIHPSSSCTTRSSSCFCSIIWGLPDRSSIKKLQLCTERGAREIHERSKECTTSL